MLAGVALLLLLGGAAHADDVADGKRLYLRLCASCHGRDGRGDGPVAKALGEPPTDLTRLAHDNGGDFPALQTVIAIDGTRTVRAHGVSEMPVWGEVLGPKPGEGEDVRDDARTTVLVIVEYLGTLQTP